MSALIERAAELRHAASEATGATWREVNAMTEGPRKRKAASAAAREADLKLQAAAIAYVAELADRPSPRGPLARRPDGDLIRALQPSGDGDGEG